MLQFPQERDIIHKQIKGRLSAIERAFYRLRLPIGGWETVVTGARRDVEAPPSDGWSPFGIATESGEREDGLGRPPAAHYNERFLGTNWGGYDVAQWFRVTVTIPKQMAGWPVVALLNPGAEALCYIDGVPTQGLDPNRSEVVLTECADGGETYEIMLEASATANAFDDDPVRTFLTPFLATKDTATWDLYWDLKVALDVSAALQDGRDKDRLLDLVDRSVKMIDLNGVGDFDAYRSDIESASRSFRREYKEFQNSFDMGTMINVGHSHIDVAWLWPLRETRKKSSRTFSTALKYMERYPDYTFSQGQPQLYEWIKEQYPTIWEGIKERVREGRWETTGGTWVEQDSNVAGGEALVRQLLYGKRFFRSEFGIDATVVWLPDAFGFPITMPQIMKKAGMRGFATTKINWSQYNKFPYSAFRWRGLDGTEIFSFMPPGAYNGVVEPGNARNIWNQFLQKDISGHVLNTYGHGDGGGGVTVEMLENLKRLGNVTGVPRMETGNIETYVDIATKEADCERLPVYHEELYLELHRACQTTQAHTKRNNRKGELMFRDAEFLAGVASLGGFAYPQETLNEAWKPLLTNQFHDILPGSSVNEVYETADHDYAQVIGAASGVRDDALAALDARIDTSGEGTPIVVRNTLGWVRNDAASVALDSADSETTVVDPSGRPVPSQVVESADGTTLLFEAPEVPSMGHAVYRVADGAKPVRNTLKVSKTRLENDFFVVRLTSRGTISSVLDKGAGREVIPEGAVANELQLFDDQPHAHDAWDVDFNIDENRWSWDDVESIEVVERGPVRATVRVVKKTEHSTLTQDISIWSSIPRIDFATSVDWHEKRRLLKVAFPVNVLSRTATYEVQYGAYERPTHHSSSYDRAKFEVPGHRWIDLSEGEHGVSLLNDCKYGFDTYQNTMRISLLRSATSPDPKADQGYHEFVYSMYPHAGGWQDAETVRRAYELNAPLVAVERESHGGDTPVEAGFVSVDKASVVIDCVKKAEDSDAIIVRLYESHGTRGPVRLAFAVPPKSVKECNLMEEDDSAADVSGSVVSFDIMPWEIRTFKVEF